MPFSERAYRWRVWRRRRESAPEPGWHTFDPDDSAAIEAALRAALPRATSATVQMCWHGGRGHDEPNHVMQAAQRLRERHLHGSTSGPEYTSLSFPPTADDLDDLRAVAPYCDLVYLTDDGDQLLFEASATNGSAAVRQRLLEERRDGCRSSNPSVASWILSRSLVWRWAHRAGARGPAASPDKRALGPRLGPRERVIIEPWRLIA